MLKSKNTFYIARRTLGDNTLTFISYWNSPDISHPTYTDNFNKAKEFESRKQALEALENLS